MNRKGSRASQCIRRASDHAICLEASLVQLGEEGVNGSEHWRTLLSPLQGFVKVKSGDLRQKREKECCLSLERHHLDKQGRR